jgi:hypothetical protein
MTESNRRRCSPQRRNSVGADAGIAGHQRHTLHHGLSNEEAIEGIALLLAIQFDIGKVAIGGAMSWRYGQQQEALDEQLLGPLLGDLELAERGFDRDLEERAGAEERLLSTLDCITGGRG